MSLGKPKRRGEDDEDAIKNVPYPRPVAGRATGRGRTKLPFPVHQLSDRDALFFRGRENQSWLFGGLQLDAEFPNPNPGSEALHGGQARPETHGFAPRAHGQPGGAEAGGQRPTFPAWPSCGPELTGGAGLDQRLQGVLVDGLSHPRQAFQRVLT